MGAQATAVPMAGRQWAKQQVAVGRSPQPLEAS